MSMTTCLVLALVSLAIFVVYNAILIKMYGVPSSLSQTFYALQEHGHWGGWFTIMMWTMSFTLLIPWIIVGNNITPWSRYLGFLPFLTCAALVFVSTAANYRKEWGSHEVHMWCAKGAAVFALLWIFIVCYKVCYIVPAWVLLIGGIAHLTKTAKSARDYWLEMVAFGSVFTSVITEIIMQLVK